MYAAMADTYARLVYGLDKPRIGVLSVGEEDSKGSVMTKRVFELLREGELNFIGNVEGGDFLKGHVDIVVTDGFTGNAVLKAVESTANTLLNTIKEGVASSLVVKFGALLMKPVFNTIRKMLDWRENAGGLLLGVKGLTVISHGRADGYAIYKSLETARKLVRVDLLTGLQQAVDIAAAALTKVGADAETAPGAPASDSAPDVK
jgi:glycerol-3-phosphate acyltransferase PlsX